MGHMDNDDYTDHFTVTVFTTGNEKEVFNGCTDVDGGGDQLSFKDRNGKSHEFYGVEYHIAQE